MKAQYAVAYVMMLSLLVCCGSEKIVYRDTSKMAGEETERTTALSIEPAEIEVGAFERTKFRALGTATETAFPTWLVEQSSAGGGEISTEGIHIATDVYGVYTILARVDAGKAFEATATVKVIPKAEGVWTGSWFKGTLPEVTNCTGTQVGSRLDRYEVY